MIAGNFPVRIVTPFLCNHLCQLSCSAIEHKPQHDGSVLSFKVLEICRAESLEYPRAMGIQVLEIFQGQQYILPVCNIGMSQVGELSVLFTCYIAAEFDPARHILYSGDFQQRQSSRIEKINNV